MKTLTMSLVALPILVGFAPVAHADNSTDYLASLDTAKISYSDPTKAISMGNTVCQQLRNNIAPETAAQAALDAGYTANQAGKILYVASHTLCSDMGAAVEKWSNTP
jgi:hypothetical protein